MFFSYIQILCVMLDVVAFYLTLQVNCTILTKTIVFYIMNKMKINSDDQSHDKHSQNKRTISFHCVHFFRNNAFCNLHMVKRLFNVGINSEMLKQEKQFLGPFNHLSLVRNKMSCNTLAKCTRILQTNMLKHTMQL